MPIYEYRCAKCGRISEFLESSSRKKAPLCPECGSRELVKRFSTFAAGMKEGQSKRCHGCSDNTCPHSRQ